MSQVRILLTQDEAGALADALAAVRNSQMPEDLHLDRDVLKAVQHQCWAAVARAMLTGLKPAKAPAKAPSKAVRGA